MSKLCFSKVYLARSLQPIHIGSGGYQVERIDNKIVRDEEDVPCIPGTTLAGAARSYFALHLDSSCGGRNGCGKEDCPVCLLFGYTADDKKKNSKGSNSRSLKGMLNFYEGRLLFYPVSTMVGPYWLTTFSRLRDFYKALDFSYDKKNSENIKNITISDKHFLPLDRNSNLQEYLDLSWLLFYKMQSELPEDQSQGMQKLKDYITKLPMLKKIIDRIIILKENMFTYVVNDTLEKRTSIAIDPATNAAAEGALFQYEAIPRDAYFYFEITFSNPIAYISTKNWNIIIEMLKNYKAITTETDDNKILPLLLKEVFPYFRVSGLGGMTTRGFGRLLVEEV